MTNDHPAPDVISAQAGIQFVDSLDSRLRGNDSTESLSAFLAQPVCVSETQIG